MPKTKFKHPLKHYATLYGVSLNTIHRYSKDGYPLDDEEATRALVASQKYQPANMGEVATPGAATPAAPAPRKTSVNARGGALGLVASIDRLRIAERAAHAEWEQAENPAVKTAKQKQWLALVKQLTDVEKASPDVQEANKRSVNIDELEITLSKTFNIFRQELEALPRRMELELVGKDVIGIREILTQEVDGIIETLFKCALLKGS